MRQKSHLEAHHNKSKYCWTRNLSELSNINMKEIINGNCFLKNASFQQVHVKKTVEYWELIIPTWKLTNLNRQVDNTDQEEMPNYDSIFLVGSLEMKFPSRTQA